MAFINDYFLYTISLMLLVVEACVWREVKVVGVGNVASLFSARAFVWGDEEEKKQLLGGHRWILGWSNLVQDTTTTKRSAVGNAWAGGGSIPVFFPWMTGHPCLTLRARSLSLQGDPANIEKG